MSQTQYNTEPAKKKHLTEKERYQIEALLKGKKAREIAEMLLCQEIAQNKVRKNQQVSKEADAMGSVEKVRRLFHTSHSETTTAGAYAQ